MAIIISFPQLCSVVSFVDFVPFHLFSNVAIIDKYTVFIVMKIIIGPTISLPDWIF